MPLSRTVAQVGPGLRRGTITRLEGTTAHVEVPAIAPGYELPATLVEGLTVAAGDTVLLVTVTGTADDVIVLARLP